MTLKQQLQKTGKKKRGGQIKHGMSGTRFYNIWQHVKKSSWKPEDEYTEEQVSLLKKIPKTWIKKRVDLTQTIK